jgi:hypothetical protein
MQDNPGTDADPAIDRVIADPALTREQKIARLRQMSYDATELEVAAGEGMPGPPSRLARIRAALRDLGAEADESCATPAPPSEAPPGPPGEAAAGAARGEEAASREPASSAGKKAKDEKTARRGAGEPPAERPGSAEGSEG